MPVTATFYAQASYEPADLMQRDADWIVSGVLSSTDLQVTSQSPAAMAVNVAGSAASASGGNAWLPGGYRINNSTVLALTITAADAVNPRIDLVVAGINTATTPYTPEVKVITGTPGSSPAVPVTPAGYLALAQVYVQANATTIVQANITDLRTIAKLNVPVAGTASGAAQGTVELPASAGTPVTPVVPYLAASEQESLLTTINATPVRSTTPAAQGTFRISVVLRVVNAPTDVTVQYSWTDASNNPQSQTATYPQVGVGQWDIPVKTINALGGDSIQITVTAGTANQVYVTSTIEAIA